MEVYDIAIVGAGPAGATCALALRDAGLHVALLDRASFPRDKVCGDAIPARAVRVLRELSPAAAQQLEALPHITSIQACTVHAPNGKGFTYPFHTPGYCARRMDFDHFLVTAATQSSSIHFLPTEGVTAIHRNGFHWTLDTPSQSLQAQLVIGCDGANGITAKQLAGFQLDPRHHCAAVRAYYGGVADLQPNTLEIHLLSDGLPGYFWIFPLGGHECNVGFGMLSHHIAMKKSSLRSLLPQLIATSPALAPRFSQARMQSKVEGFGLPLGSRWPTMSGNGFLLCGDAAALIDPATGEGIGNAMWSAQVAARWAIAAFQRNDFSAAFLQGYARELKAKLWRELRQKYWVQRGIANRPGLINGLVSSAGKGGLVNWLVKKIF